ncbi:MAG: hypothetical protein Q9164_005229 [Protoblastenia rupestris]
MTSIHNILSYTFLFALLTPSLAANAFLQIDQGREAKPDLDAFQKLLNQVDPPALHAALHDFSPKKFKHGMFQEDRTAVEAIHREEPSIATGIVKMASLFKRQNNATVPTTTSDQEPAQPATTRVTPVPVDGESTTAPPLEGETSTAVEDEPFITTSTNAAGEASVITSAPDTMATQTSSPSSPSLTAGEVITTTNSVGLTVISTVGGGATTLSPSESAPTNAARSSLTSTLVRTSTLPNGEQSTITAVTVIGGGGGAPDTPTGVAGVGATSTRSGQPGLQTGEAVMTRGFGKEMAVVLGAAVGVAYLL